MVAITAVTLLVESDELKERLVKSTSCKRHAPCRGSTGTTGDGSYARLQRSPLAEEDL